MMGYCLDMNTAHTSTAAFASYENVADGVRAEVFELIDGRYSVRLLDTDAGECLPWIRIFLTADAACSYARSLVP